MVFFDPFTCDDHYCCHLSQIFNGVKVLHMPAIAQCYLYSYLIKLSLVRKW